ncbi:hypothetical protein Syun_023974 [Stephania yunnanensis]|uniref:Uncharacterized protein n=1 Tax=Stephania yunnanensis TaxID=152371 RepID=A0AAP0FPL3_9MAGN
MMAFSPLQLFSISSILLLLLIFISDSGVECRLSTNYYSKSCPNLATIVGNVVTDKQIRSPTTAAGHSASSSTTASSQAATPQSSSPPPHSTAPSETPTSTSPSQATPST